MSARKFTLIGLMLWFCSCHNAQKSPVSLFTSYDCHSGSGCRGATDKLICKDDKCGVITDYISPSQVTIKWNAERPISQATCTLDLRSDCGAMGDGHLVNGVRLATDDTLAFQKCFNAAEQLKLVGACVGTTLTLQGTFGISQALNLP